MIRKPKSRAQDSGFTLVELMIVIVIISFLSSLAIPKFGAIIARAKLTELKQGLWHIISLERAYYHAYDDYIECAFGEDSTQLGFAQPDGHFIYGFDKGTLKASGMESGVGHDINFDVDGDDGLTVTIDGTEGIITGSDGPDFAW